MTDFFYQGQKDLILQLNRLAGRGAVVGSYAPAAGMSPLGGANGRINPAWLDVNLPLRSDAPIGAGPSAKFGYSYLQQNRPAEWYKLALLPAESMGAHENLLISGIVNDNWGAGSSSPITIFMGVRGGFYVDWHVDGALRSQAQFQVYREDNGVHAVYMHFRANTFCSVAFDMMGMDAVTYALPVRTLVTPPGTLVFSSASTDQFQPRWQGNDAPGVPDGAQSTRFPRALFVGDGTISTSYLAPGKPGAPSGGYSEVSRWGVGGNPGLYAAGCWSWLTAQGLNQRADKTGYRLSLKAYDAASASFTPEIAAFEGTGTVRVPGTLKVGTDDSASRNTINRGAGPGDEIIYFGRSNVSQPCVAILNSNGAGGWNGQNSVLYGGRSATTNRSGNFAGTLNTSGNDYAEYIGKAPECDVIAKGQIIGITAQNQVTDVWALAVLFAVKSTDPSFVGGDSWGHAAGVRPSPTAADAPPAPPERRADAFERRLVPQTAPPEYEMVLSQAGHSDAEWAEKLDVHAAASALHAAAVEHDREALSRFEAAMERERAKVDRIAIAGRVPVNVLGAQPGDYIVPVQDGTGIAGVAVRAAAISVPQYLAAVGRVISVESDGRACIMVKAV